MIRRIIGLIFIILTASAVHSQVKFNLGEEYKALDYYLDGIKNGQVYSFDYIGKRKIYIKGYITNVKDSVTWYKRNIKIFKMGQKREVIWIGSNSNMTLAGIILYNDKVHLAEILVTDISGNQFNKKIAPEYFTQKNDFIKN